MHCWAGRTPLHGLGRSRRDQTTLPAAGIASTAAEVVLGECELLVGGARVHQAARQPRHLSRGLLRVVLQLSWLDGGLRWARLANPLDVGEASGEAGGRHFPQRPICSMGRAQPLLAGSSHAATAPSHGRRRPRPPLMPRPTRHRAGAGRSGPVEGGQDRGEVAPVQLEQGPVVLLVVEALPGGPPGQAGRRPDFAGILPARRSQDGPGRAGPGRAGPSGVGRSVRCRSGSGRSPWTALGWS